MIKRSTTLKCTSERRKIIAKLDKLVSNIVRERADWTCFRCGTKYTPPTASLHCSHYFPREKMGTRFDMDNLDAACYACHFYHLEKQKQGFYRDFKLKQLGQQRYDLLEHKATSIAKYSTSELGLLYELLKKENV